MLIYLNKYELDNNKIYIYMQSAVSEQYEKSSAAQLPIDEIEKDKYNKNDKKNIKSILLKKIEDSNARKKKPTQDTISPVKYQSDLID